MPSGVLERGLSNVYQREITSDVVYCFPWTPCRYIAFPSMYTLCPRTYYTNIISATEQGTFDVWVEMARMMANWSNIIRRTHCKNAKTSIKYQIRLNEILLCSITHSHTSLRILHASYEQKTNLLALLFWLEGRADSCCICTITKSDCCSLLWPVVAGFGQLQLVVVGCSQLLMQMVPVVHQPVIFNLPSVHPQGVQQNWNFDQIVSF